MPKLAVDAKASSKVDHKDAILIPKSIVGLCTFTPDQSIAADFNSSHAIDLGDTDVQLVGILKGDLGGRWTA